MADQDATQVMDGTEQGEQTVSVEDIGPARKRLTIELPAERIADKVKNNIDRLREETAIPGFRKGRAPTRLLERRFGDTLRGDVRRQLLTESYTQAIEDESLDVIGEPEIQDAEDIEIPDDGPLTFKVEIEVSPKVDLPDLEGLKIDKPPFEVSDDDVAEELGRLQLRVGQVSEHKDAKIAADDMVVADVRILPGEDAGDDAEPIHQHADSPITMPGKQNAGQGHVLGIPVDDLEKELKGKKPGESLRLSVQGPPVHEDEKIQDQPLTIVLDIKTIHRREPGTIEQVVQSAGLESEQELKERVRELLTARAEREQRSAIHKQICKYLTDNVKIDLPEKMTARQTARTLRRQAMEMAYRGMEREQIEQEIAKIRQSSEDQSKQQLHLFFVLDQAAKSLDIEVTEAEINGQIAMLAQQQGRRPEKMRQHMQKEGEIDHLFLMIREQKTLDAILEKANVTTVEAKPKAGKTEKAKSDKGDKKASKPKSGSKKKTDTEGSASKSTSKPKQKPAAKSTKKKDTKASNDKKSS